MWVVVFVLWSSRRFCPPSSLRFCFLSFSSGWGCCPLLLCLFPLLFWLGFAVLFSSFLFSSGWCLLSSSALRLSPVGVACPLLRRLFFPFFVFFRFAFLFCVPSFRFSLLVRVSSLRCAFLFSSCLLFFSSPAVLWFFCSRLPSLLSSFPSSLSFFSLSFLLFFCFACVFLRVLSSRALLFFLFQFPKFFWCCSCATFFFVGWFGLFPLLSGAAACLPCCFCRGGFVASSRFVLLFFFFFLFFFFPLFFFLPWASLASSPSWLVPFCSSLSAGRCVQFRFLCASGFRFCQFFVFRFFGFVSLSFPVLLLCFLFGLGFRPVVWSRAGGCAFARFFRCRRFWVLGHFLASGLLLTVACLGLPFRSSPCRGVWSCCCDFGKFFLSRCGWCWPRSVLLTSLGRLLCLDCRSRGVCFRLVLSCCCDFRKISASSF